MSNPAPTLAEAQRHIRALERELERSEVVVTQAVGETFRMRERVVSLENRVRELEGELMASRVRETEKRRGVRRATGTWRG
jgi:ABC-type nitrate/sulfonate/bicarbonate transport system ATPase subunit